MILAPYLAEAGLVGRGENGMSNVVAFRPERNSRVVVHARDEGAEILFFTGIRYVREELLLVLTEPAPDAADQAAAEAREDFATERLKA